MGTISLILIVIIGLLVIFKAILKKPDDLKKIKTWELEIFIAVLLLANGIIDHLADKPLTREEEVEASKEGTRQALCEWDPYKDRIAYGSDLDKISKKDRVAIDSDSDMIYKSERDSLIRMAKCLSKIATSSLEKGLVAIGLEDYDKAVIHLEYSISANSDNHEKLAQSYFYLSIAQKGQGKYASAIISADSSLKYFPDSGPAWMNKGALYYDIGNYRRALDCYWRANELIPYHPALWCNFGAVFGEMGKNKEALAWYNRAIDKKHNYVIAWFGRANILAQMDSLMEAINAYDSCLKYQPSYYPALLNKGNTLHRLGKDREALDVLDEALKYNSSYMIWRSRVIVLFDLLNWEEARKSCDSALFYRPKDPSILYIIDEINEKMAKKQN